MIVFECVVPPVVVKVPVIEPYAVPAEVEYLQVADSLVERDMVVWVVPAGRVPEGLGFDCVGGVVSVTTMVDVFPETTLDNGEELYDSSNDLMAK